ncbi:MAG TPA: hypothetical protein VK281_17835 [Xanthobacteraceae bacterium]|nr:hypothetical protein [Xanthobacteraceae bacterium]
MTMAHHMASGMVPNFSGWIVPSTRCMAVAAISVVPIRITRQPASARRSA